MDLGGEHWVGHVIGSSHSSWLGVGSSHQERRKIERGGKPNVNLPCYESRCTSRNERSNF